jgi:NAD(P)-dependent dehydrogenase (short-subunit alcohol dehydrogenase family)
VTGASRGIGRATAAALARAGAHVLVHYYGRSAREAESLVSEIEAKGGLANAITADLGTPNGAPLLAKQVRSIVGDRLDVLVRNAGISKAARLADYTVGEFDNLFATNVRSLDCRRYCVHSKPNPWRHARLIAPIHYHQLEDIVAEWAAKNGAGRTVLRPHTVMEPSLNSPMNLVASLATYAAMTPY